MGVDDVGLIRPGDDAVGHGEMTADDQVIAAQIELFDGQRPERQIGPEVPGREGQVLDEGRLRMPTVEEVVLAMSIEVDEGEEVGVGKDRQDLFEHPLGATVDGQRIRNDGGSQCGKLRHCRRVGVVHRLAGRVRTDHGRIGARVGRRDGKLSAWRAWQGFALPGCCASPGGRCCAVWLSAPAMTDQAIRRGRTWRQPKAARRSARKGPHFVFRFGKRCRLHRQVFDNIT